MRTILFFVCFVSLASASIAQGVLREAITVGADFGVGARAMGMGGAHVATASDASAMYWNPAGLVFLRRIELATTLSRESSKIETRFFDGLAENTEHSTRLNSIALGYPIPTLRGSLVIGAAVNRVHSFDQTYIHEGYNTRLDFQIEDGDTVFTSGDSYERETQTSSGGLYTWVLACAADVSEQLSLGLALNIWDGTYKGVFALDDTDQHDVWYFSDEHLTQEDDFDLDGFNVSFGGIYRATRRLNFGLAVNSQVTLSYDGEQKETFSRVCDESADNNQCNEGDYEDYYTFSDSKIPWTFSFGAAYTEKMFKLAFDASYADWSEIDKNPLAQDSRYKETLKLRVGAETIIPHSPVRLRAGLYSDPLPYQGTKIDKDRLFVTVGFGFLLDRIFAIDVAYVTGNWKRVDPNYQYEAKNTSSRLFLSGAYHF